MNQGKKLLVAVLAVAGLSGCASTQYAERKAASAQPPAADHAAPQVSRPASYGTMGGYRYRRFTAVTVAGA
jgi:hypothetical protein